MEVRISERGWDCVSAGEPAGAAEQQPQLASNERHVCAFSSTTAPPRPPPLCRPAHLASWDQLGRHLPLCHFVLVERRVAPVHGAVRGAELDGRVHRGMEPLGANLRREWVDGGVE
jgi:hypothetical protein